MRKKNTPNLFFRGSLGMFGTMPRYTCHTTESLAKGTFHAQRKYHRKATRKVFPQSCNFNLREPQHTPGAYPTPLGSGSGVCSRGMLANSWIQTSNKSKQPQILPCCHNVGGFFSQEIPEKIQTNSCGPKMDMTIFPKKDSRCKKKTD